MYAASGINRRGTGSRAVRGEGCVCVSVCMFRRLASRREMCLTAGATNREYGEISKYTGRFLSCPNGVRMWNKFIVFSFRFFFSTQDHPRTV